MGYLIACVLIIALIVLLVAALGHSKPPRGTLSGKPQVRSEPSADEPTPDASSTASPSQTDQARRHTPPA